MDFDLMILKNPLHWIPRHQGPTFISTNYENPDSLRGASNLPLQIKMKPLQIDLNDPIPVFWCLIEVISS